MTRTTAARARSQPLAEDDETKEAATAGSRLMSTPKTRAGILRKASSSSEYGMAEESIATPNPARSSHGSSSARPRAGIPTGASTTVPTHSAMASPVPPGKTLPVRALRSM